MMHMRNFFILAFLLLSNSAFTQSQPQNSHKNPYGSGWECNRGFKQVGNECQKVQIPLNAVLDILGHDWECSRDTQENAANSWELLYKRGITRIALVTHTTHMPRASLEFERFGFEVVETAVGQPTLGSETILGWLPGASNLELSQSVLRELLAKLIQKIKSHE